MVLGRAERARVTLRGLRVAGLRLAAVDVRAEGVRVVPGYPVRLRTERVRLRAHVEQTDLDGWSHARGLPLRLRFHDGAVSARTGIAGRRLGDAEIGVRLDSGRLQLVPRRANVLGLAVSAGALFPAVTLPLPPFPRRAELVAVEPTAGAIDLAFELAEVVEELTVERLRSAWARLGEEAGTPATERRGHPAGSPPPDGAQPVIVHLA
jgi:hypothetical protein